MKRDGVRESRERERERVGVERKRESVLIIETSETITIKKV